ncbi:MAG: hypothetical protein JWP89_25 [Schlesneria sp.]|nr:hypothetical protein [Schlesneria sp.]
MHFEYELRDMDVGTLIVPHLALATGYWSRLIGLQFRRELGTTEGLLLSPCQSIHTCFLRFALEVAFLDKSGRIIGVVPELKPWRMAFAPRGTFAVLEIASGRSLFRRGHLLSLGSSSNRRGTPFPMSLAGMTANHLQ